MFTGFSKIVISGAVLLGCLQCAKSPSVTKGAGSLHLVDFPKWFERKDPALSKEDLIVTTGEFEVRRLSRSPSELLFGMKDYDEAYAENFYAVSLDGQFKVRPASANEWSQSEQLPTTRVDPGSSAVRVIGDSVEYRGKMFAKTGRSWESTAALPSPRGKWLVVFSHTSEKDKPSYGVMGGGGRGKGEMYLDVYDTSSGEKILSASAPHRGEDKPSRLFNHALWAGDRYLIVPLDPDAWVHAPNGAQGESIFLGVLPEK
jgi:hypothetical protein